MNYLFTQVVEHAATKGENFLERKKKDLFAEQFLIQMKLEFKHFIKHTYLPLNCIKWQNLDIHGHSVECREAAWRK